MIIEFDKAYLYELYTGGKTNDKNIAINPK